MVNVNPDISSNEDLYDFILSLIGYSFTPTNDKKNILFYGSVNQRFNNKLKFRKVK